MAQQDYDNFKQRLKDWMEIHPNEYNQFEESMNQRDSMGYQMIMTKAMMLVPEYQKLIKKKINTGTFDDASDIETFLSQRNLAQTLIDEIESPNKDFIIPVVMCWLYFGKSFERMVEQGEEIKNNPETSFLQKQLVAHTIKLLISKSIKLGLRTNEDWETYNKLKKAINNNQIIDWAMQSDEMPEPEKKKPGRKKSDKSLSEMFSIHVPDNDLLIEKIEQCLTSKHSELDIAYLKIALEELYYLYGCDVKPFRDALDIQFREKIPIVGERGVQKSYSRLTSPMSGTKKLAENIGEDREAIDTLKEFLHN